MILFRINLVFLFSVLSVCEKTVHEFSSLGEYDVFLNYGQKKIPKFNKHNLENSIFKSKTDILGSIFRKNIEGIKLGTEKVDLVFLIDASSSVGEDNFLRELRFVRKLLNDMPIGLNAARIAVVTYSSPHAIYNHVDQISKPNPNNNKCHLLNKQLNEISYTGGGTYTLGAFQLAKNILSNGRNDSRKVIVLVTDGFSNGGDPVPVARELKTQHVTIFTLGIRNGNYRELYELSTQPGQYYSYLLDSFAEFESLARRALHSDLRGDDDSGYGTVDRQLCNSLCGDSTDCCDPIATCTCGASSGRYTCVCPKGYYGTGIYKECYLCPEGTYGAGWNLCKPCPDPHHKTIALPATSRAHCYCKHGYRISKDDPLKCEPIKCLGLEAPDNGYWVSGGGGPEFNTPPNICGAGALTGVACGARCRVGWVLTGDSIRVCGSDGHWSGVEVKCEPVTCPMLLKPSPTAVLKCYDEDSRSVSSELSVVPVDTTCELSCGPGYTLVGSRSRTCLPLGIWDGLNATCKTSTCPRLPKIPYGFYSPTNCSSRKQLFGQNCSVSCQTGFKIHGPKLRNCNARGQWSDRKQISTCEDIISPTLTCPDNITTEANKGKNYAFVTWAVPIVTDNTGLNVSLWSKPDIHDPTVHKFRIGVTNVTYIAADVVKNKAKCSFFVTILDKEPPEFEDCIDPPPFLTPDKGGANLTWDDPEAFDNNNNIVHISKSQEFGWYPTGVTQVTYTATDTYNNSNKCILNITVEEINCEELVRPEHGVANCENGKCVLTCDDGYGFSIHSSNESIDIITDAEGDFKTICAPYFTPPDCTVTALPASILEEGIFNLDTDEDICEDTILDELKKNYKEQINKTCTDGTSCILNNISTVCERNNTESIERVKRNVNLSKTLTNNTSTRVKGRRHRKRKRINIKYKLTWKNANKTIDEDVVNKGREKIRNIDLGSQKNSSLSEILNKANYTVVHNVEKIVLECSEGYVSTKTRCMRCPRGTFKNSTRNQCQSCPASFYNDKPGQLSCKQCPNSTTTLRIRSKSARECNAPCFPGTRTRLIRQRNPQRKHFTIFRCIPCKVGYYQPLKKQSKCKKCPKGFTTHKRGGAKCVPIEVPVEKPIIEIQNKCVENPCQEGGVCVPVDKAPGFECACSVTQSGERCEEKSEQVSDQEDPKLELITLCALKNTCDNNATCSLNGIFDYHCICKNGFIGKRCDRLPCDYLPCSKHHICVNLIENSRNTSKESFRCECPRGHTGPKCTELINYCTSIPCSNGGTCTNDHSTYSFKCQCPPPFTGVTCDVALDSKFILEFKTPGITDYVELDGPEKQLEEVSVCLWLKTSDFKNYGTIFSYATTKSDNCFTLTDYSGLVLYINGQHRVSDILLNDGKWHFICVTWRSINGSYTIYVDGDLKDHGVFLGNGTIIEGNGKFVVGQEQDTVGGMFSQSESFLGQLKGLDLWGRILNQSEIYKMMTTCEVYYGDLIHWGQFKENTHGKIEIKNSTFCQPCSKLKEFENGNISVNDTIATYSCKKGYKFKFPKDMYTIVMTEDNSLIHRMCTKTGEWEGNEDPTCERITCGPPERISNGDIWVQSTDYSYDTTVDYSCKEGYTLVGISKRTCLQTGYWSYLPPICAREAGPEVSCEPLSPPPGVVSAILLGPSGELDSFIEPGSQMEFECEQGLELVGESVLSCLEDGEWDEPIPQCIKIEQTTTPVALKQCSSNDLPAVPLNGYYISEIKFDVLHENNEKIEFRCRFGYELHGENYTTCLTSGKWSNVTTKCLPVRCMKPPPQPFNMIRLSELNPMNHYEFGNMVRYSCKPGFELHGNLPSARCTASGLWSRITSRCTKISCNKPNVPAGATINGNSYLFGSIIRVECPSVIKPVLNQKAVFVQCYANKTWLPEVTCN